MSCWRPLRVVHTRRHIGAFGCRLLTSQRASGMHFSASKKPSHLQVPLLLASDICARHLWQIRAPVCARSARMVARVPNSPTIVSLQLEVICRNPLGTVVGTVVGTPIFCVGTLGTVKGVSC